MRGHPATPRFQNTVAQNAQSRCRAITESVVALRVTLRLNPRNASFRSFLLSPTFTDRKTLFLSEFRMLSESEFAEFAGFLEWKNCVFE
jgi:hypothetical protein